MFIGDIKSAVRLGCVTMEEWGGDGPRVGGKYWGRMLLIFSATVIKHLFAARWREDISGGESGNCCRC